MRKQILKIKLLLIVILCLMFILPSANIFAQHRSGGHGGAGHGNRGYGGRSHNWGHSSRGWWDWGYHHPRGYHWYNGGWWLGDAIVEGLVVGATLSALPPSYSTVYVGRVPYYYDGIYYYRPYASGYVVVANPTIAPAVVTAPVVVQPTVVTTNIEPQTQPSGTITINVPNSKGGYTSVLLTKRNDGYLGPQGEFYPGNPTVDQLKALYGQ